MTRLRDVPAELLVMAGLGLVLGLLGPFGTYASPVSARVGLWVVLAIGGYGCFRPVIAAGRSLSEEAHLSLMLAIGLACIVASLPVTVMVALLFGAGLQPATLTDTYPSVLLVGALATAIQFLLFGRRPISLPITAPAPSSPSPADPEPAPVAYSPPPARFLDRLPHHLGRELLCLEMEDHYVRAHTALGSTLLLMRLRDATAELSGIEGERVHRSWWVARAAVATVAQRERAIALSLTNGLDVPVARNSVPLLRSKGWL